jgi:phosphonate transport system substrate-binding protein
MLRILTRFAAAAAFLLAGLAHGQDVNFGIISTDSASAQRERWQPFFDDMQKQTGLRVNAFYAPDYNGIIEAMRFNKVQVAWYGNKAAMEAVDRANGEVFAQVVYADGTMGYNSILIVHKDSPIRSVDDLLKNGKQYAFGNGDPNSTSGFLVPSFYLWAPNRIDPATHFKASRSASHGANLQAVINRQVDVATNNTEDLGRLKATQPDKAAEIRVIWTSPLIPSDPFVWRKDLAPEAKEKLRAFVLGYGRTPEEKAVLKNIYNYGSFRPSTNAQLIPIRQLELARNRMKIEASEGLSADEKRAKLVEIDASLAQIEKQAKAQ